MRILALAVVVAAACGNPAASPTPVGPSNTAPEPVVDHFPLVEGAVYHYQGLFSGTEYQARVDVRTVEREGRKVYYFADEPETSIIRTTAFGLGGYLKEGDTLKTVDAFWLRDLVVADPSNAQPLITLPPRVGESHVLTASEGEMTATVTVESVGDVTVPAGTFRNCAVIRIVEDWKEGESSTGRVWLAEGVGVVRWERNTGRVDVLVSVEGL